ncbi:hypothetical protein [Hymenobacter bucti]|uniref:DUF3887 domain-containing protein n=1 Tax=Hymenobacter bucti TaxID=1844114 RepID=A0ABW4QVA0_9BACT
MPFPLPRVRSFSPWLGAGAALLSLVSAFSFQPAPRATQAQVARRFLSEVLRADYPAAYRRLASEVRDTLRPAAFAAATQPLWHLGQQRGPAVELYKLGTWLSEGGGPEPWFYRFSFANDSARRPPPVLLEVTFRDTTARQVLGFGVRNH